MSKNYYNYYQKKDYQYNNNYWQKNYDYKYNTHQYNNLPKYISSYDTYNENKFKYYKKYDESKEINFLNKKRNAPQENKIEKDSDNKNIVQFFSPNDKNKLNNIIEKLESAKDSLDIAMYTLTNVQLIDTILKCFDNKVRVRIILDYKMTRRYGWFLKELIMNGIYIKTNDNPEESMHHKFAIVDNKFVFNGSLNWSEKGVTKNHENITILDDEKIAQQFTSQFDDLWLKFGDIISLSDIEQKGKFYNDKNYMPKYYYRNYNQYKNYFDRNGYKKEQFFEDYDDDDSDSDSESESDSESDSEDYYEEKSYYPRNKGYYNNYRYKKYGYYGYYKNKYY